jgi:hypothetical protein
MRKKITQRTFQRSWRTGWSLPVQAALLSYLSCTDDPALELRDMCIEGVPVWSDADPVHAAPGFYKAMSRLIQLMKWFWILHKVHQNGPAWNA